MNKSKLHAINVEYSCMHRPTG